MIPFLDEISKRLLDKYHGNLDHICVVLPSKRSIVFFKHYLSKHIDSPIILPQFFSIEEFVEEISGLTVLDNLSLQFYLYQVYSNNPLKGKEKFGDFLSWSSTLLHDFNEVDKNLVDPDLIFSNLKEVKSLESWDLEDWSLSEDLLSEQQEDFVSFFDKISLWYSDFRSLLLENNFAYQGLANRIASENINDYKLKYEKVWFVGLNALTKSEQSLLDFLKRKDIARVFWDADTYYYDNPLHESGSFLRDQREKWHEIDFKGVKDYFSKPKNIFEIIGCPKNIAQSKVVAKILSKIKDDDLSQSNTAIILSDERLLYPVLHNLPTNVKKLNVTMGSPLIYTPFYTFIDYMFRMQVNLILYDKNAFYFQDVLMIIDLPILHKVVDSSVLHRFKKHILDNNIVFITDSLIDSFLDYDSNIVTAIFKKWKDYQNVFLSLHDIISVFKECISDQGPSIEIEVIFTFYKSINRLERLINNLQENIELKTLHKVFKDLISKETISFTGEPLNGLQVMGILESRTLDFKNVILVSVNEGVLPKGRLNNSFIPYDLKKYFQMPTYVDRDAVFAYHFYRILQRAKNISLLYNTEMDELGMGEKSRFITQLLSEYKHGDIKEYIYHNKDGVLVQNNTIVIPNYDVKHEIAMWLRSGVSPSALNLYNKCSLSFYYRYLSKIKKEDQVEEFVESSTLGTAIHESFRINYLKGKLSSAKLLKIKGKLIDHIELEFQKIIPETNMKEGKNYLSLQVAKHLASNFIDFEIDFLRNLEKKKGVLQIIDAEGMYEYKTHINNFEVLLKGQVDRVDKLEDTIRIIDYKTGSVQSSEVSFSSWDELINDSKKGKALQLIIYAYLYLKNHPEYLDNKVVAGNFSFKNLRNGLIPVSLYENFRKRNLVIFNKDILEKVEGLIEDIINKLLTNDFVQTDDFKICEWCEFNKICNR